MRSLCDSCARRFRCMMYGKAKKRCPYWIPDWEKEARRQRKDWWGWVK